MYRDAVSVRGGAAIASAVLATIALSATSSVGVSLKVSHETAPPGGMAQMKVFVTEPKPISTGRGRATFSGFGSTSGIALLSPANDTLGVAVLRGTDLVLSFVSPSATLGTDSDYPILTVTGQVPPATPVGTKFPFVIDAGLAQLFDASGTVYPTEVKDGELVAAPGVSVHDVLPGSADLAAGSVVTILGSGFEPSTRVRFQETKLAAVKYISPSRIDVVLARAARMHGMEIRVENPGSPRVEYFSYQRTKRQGTSVHPVLRDVVPLFPFQTTLNAEVEVVGATSGLALQNVGVSTATVNADLLAADGVSIGAATLDVPASTFVVREISEIFGTGYEPSFIVSVRATAPVQVMGLAVDTTDAVTPLLPR